MLRIVFGPHANLNHENGSGGDEIVENAPPWSGGNEAHRVGLVGDEGDNFPSGRDAGGSSGAVKAPRSSGFVRNAVVEAAEARAVDEDASVVILERESKAVRRHCYGAEARRIVQGEAGGKIGPPFLNVEFQRRNDALDVGPCPIDGGRGVERREDVTCYSRQFYVLEKVYGGG